MRARPVVLSVAVVGAVVAVAFVATVSAGRSSDVSGDTATVGRAVAAVTQPSTTVALATTTTVTVTVAPRATASAVGGDRSVGEEPPGLVITNSGSATASVGGNVVAGNSSSIRTP